MDRNVLEFLFVGPLFSIWKRLNSIERNIVSVQDSVNSYAQRIETAVGVVRDEIEDLKAKVAAGESVDFTALEAAVGDVESLEPPQVSEPPAETPAEGTQPPGTEETA